MEDGIRPRGAGVSLHSLRERPSFAWCDCRHMRNPSNPYASWRSLSFRKLLNVNANKDAEREGFEPSIQFYLYTSLAGTRFRPLSHLSTKEDENNPFPPTRQEKNNPLSSHNMSEKKNKIITPPNSKESEMMVLGCMLTNHSSLNIGADSLDDSDFYYTEHKIIFSILKNSYKRDKPADTHLVCEEIKRLDKVEAVGGLPYITTLAGYAGTSAYLEQYAEVVKSKSILRRMIDAARDVEKKAIQEPDDVHTALDDAQALFYKISQAANPGSGILISDLLSGVKSTTQLPFLKELEDRQENFRLKGNSNEPAITGLPTHFFDLDKTINGLNNSHLIILAGRPAMGKTAFALNIAENLCFKSNVPVGIFSLEMTAEQLLHRIICSQSEVESEKIRTGALTNVEFQRIVSTVYEMQKHTMVIDDQPGLKITDLRARARRLKEAYGIKLLVIDYLQLLSGSGSSRNVENRQNEISEISRMLKNLARELDIPIICPSQLSRKVEDRAGHRPMMSDLRESGSIEQDADIVMFMLRREYYDPNDKPGQAEIIVAKNRHGAIGNINLTFVKELAQFRNYSPLHLQQENDSFATL